VTLRGISFALPEVSFLRAKGKIANLEGAQLEKLVDPRIAEMVASIGVSAAQCDRLTVENCTFTYAAGSSLVYAVGVFARGVCTRLVIEGCSFNGSSDFVIGPAGPSHLLYGFLHSSAAIFKNVPVPGRPAPAGTVLPSSLDDAIVCDNDFTGLTAAVLVMADCGQVRAENNVIRDCLYGIILFSMRALPSGVGGLDGLTAAGAAVARIQSPLIQLIADPSFQYAAALSWGYPLPPTFDWSNGIQVNASRATFPSKASISELDTAFKSMTLALPAAAAAAKTTVAQARATAAEARATAAEAKALAATTTVVSSRSSLLFLYLAALEYQAIGSANLPQLALSLRLAVNDVDAFLSDGTSASALWIWDYQRSTPGELTLDGNHLKNRSTAIATAMVLAVNRCAITGNLVLNQTSSANKDGGHSLMLYPGTEKPLSGAAAFAPVAVTGNVFRGTATLPVRSTAVPSPLNSWHWFNAEL
jgi:hypothetical protein